MGLWGGEESDFWGLSSVIFDSLAKTSKKSHNPETPTVFISNENRILKNGLF